MSAPVVCSIGTTDPWNAAGLGLDILALSECGAYPVTVTAGVTAQDGRGVHAQAALSPGLVRAQLAALGDAGIGAYRIGALLDVPTVETVAEFLGNVRVPSVYDPALAPSGGGRFGDDAVLIAIRERLVPAVTVVTPNLFEAARLSGFDVVDARTMALAARALVVAGAGAALVKGGHLHGRTCDVLVERDGDADLAAVTSGAGARAVGGPLAGSDERASRSGGELQAFGRAQPRRVEPKPAWVYEGERLPGTLRGTGCLLAAALAAALARGLPLRDAIDVARAFVRSKIAAPRVRGGMPVAY